MPVIFRSPQLSDYFGEVAGVRAGTPASAIPSIIEPYEAGQVLAFPDLKFEIDHDFWASLPTDGSGRLKKLSSSPGERDYANDPLLEKKLEDAGIDAGLKKRLKREILRLYEQALPVYEALFEGYRFVRRQAVWRLNTIRNENMHLDTYKTDFPEHFARLFINLDREPRIWMTSYTVGELFERFSGAIPRALLEQGEAGEVRVALNAQAFGGKSNIWWDNQPRHVAYFDPGEVWAVDSRQVAHQIFYGRRAVSIDFFVETPSMRDPARHYLAMAERLRRRALESPAVAAE